jgi:ATP-binding cassette subfamily B protein
MAEEERFRFGLLESLRVLYGYLGRHRRALVASVAVVASARVAQALLPLATRYLLDDVLIAGAPDRLLGALGVLAFLTLYHEGGERFGWNYFQYRTSDVRHDLQVRAQRTLLAASLAFHHEQRVGDLLQRTHEGIRTLTHALREILMHGILALGQLLLCLAALFYLDVRLGMAIAPIVAVAWYAVFRFTHRVKDTYRGLAEEEGRVNARAQEDLGALALIKAFAREDARTAEFSDRSARVRDLAQRALVDHEVFYGTFALAGNLVRILVVVGASWLAIHGEISVGSVPAALAYAGTLWWPMANVAFNVDTLNRARATLERLHEVLDAPATLTYPETGPDPREHASRVELEGVSFSYLPGRPALRDLDLVVEPGTRLAICGPSGAGKSTLLGLLLRLHDPDTGSVRVGGVDLREVPRAHFAGLLGLVEQTPVLLAGTVHENIAFARPDATREQVAEAARRANAASFVEELPDGYDSLVGERGVKLSGGQRQRICLARAFLADPQVLLLDEATASVEAESEQLILDALDRLMAERTTIVVSHKLHLAARCDTIVVVEDGRIVDRGTHAELRTRFGWYARMASLRDKAEARAAG